MSATLSSSRSEANNCSTAGRNVSIMLSIAYSTTAATWHTIQRRQMSVGFNDIPGHIDAYIASMSKPRCISVRDVQTANCMMHVHSCYISRYVRVRRA